jgi:hypothetical protein
MTLFSISPSQLLDVWDDLHRAMLGNHSYGSNVAEIYMFRVMPHNPLHSIDPFADRMKDEFYVASCNFHAIFRLFEERHNVVVEFENGESIDALLNKASVNNHRMHIRVRDKDAE